MIIHGLRPDESSGVAHEKIAFEVHKKIAVFMTPIDGEDSE